MIAARRRCRAMFFGRGYPLWGRRGGRVCPSGWAGVAGGRFGSVFCNFHNLITSFHALIHNSFQCDRSIVTVYDSMSTRTVASDETSPVQGF